MAERLDACTQWLARAEGQAEQAKALAHRASAQMSLYKFDEALNDALAAIAANPQDAFATWIAAAAFAAKGEFGPSLAMYDQTIALRPKQAKPRIERAALHRRLGNSSASRNDLDEAIKIDPSSKALCRRAQLSLEDRDLAKAEKDVRQGLATEPNDGFCLLQRARLLLEKNDPLRAMVDAEAAISRVPRSAESFRTRGRAHWAQRQTDRANRDFESFFALQPSRTGHIGLITKSLSDHTVIYVSPNSPAAQAGVRVNDTIVSRGGVGVAALRADHFGSFENASPGLPVTLEIKSGSSIKRFTILRKPYWNNASRTLQSSEPRGVIGMKFAAKNGQLVVQDVVVDGPAHRAGLSPGDIIVAIDNSSVEGLPFKLVEEKVRGPGGTVVTFDIRNKVGQPARRCSVTRSFQTVGFADPLKPNADDELDPSAF